MAAMESDHEQDPESQCEGEGGDDPSASCRHCYQKFGQPDKDVPDGCDEVLVTRPKCSASICSPCFYTQRGSFPGVNQQDMEKSKKEHPPVETKFLALRKAKVRDNCLHPGKRTRHERVKLAELIKKSEESYVDFQEVNELVSLSTYLTKHHKTKRKFKTEKDRKTYITRELKLAVQKDPRTGNYAVPVPMKTLMLTGHRLSATRSKEEQFEDKASSKEAFSKAAEGVAVKGNTKEKRVQQPQPGQRRFATLPLRALELTGKLPL